MMFSFEEQYIDDRYYASDSLVKGRKVKKTFIELSTMMMALAEEHGERNIKTYAQIDYPFWHSEEKIGWMLAVFFYEQEYLIWPEWVEENNTDQNKKKTHRKIDFLVAKDDLDMFIEFKKIGGGLGCKSILYSFGRDKLKSNKENGSGLLEQVYNMKDITPNYNKNKVLAGILIVNSTMLSSAYNDERDKDFQDDFKGSSKQLLDEVNEMIDGRRNMHLIANHAIVNWSDGDIKELDVTYVPKMLSIIGIFCSPKT